MVPQHVLHDGEIHRVVPVNQNIAETDHVAKGHRQSRRDPLAALEQVEELAVCARLPKPFIRYDVRGDIQGRLDGELQCVFHETLFANVLTEEAGLCERAQLVHTSLDLPELLRDQLGIGHEAARSSFR